MTASAVMSVCGAFFSRTLSEPFTYVWPFGWSMSLNLTAEAACLFGTVTSTVLVTVSPTVTPTGSLVVPSLPTVVPLRCTWTFLSTLTLFALTTAVPRVRHCGSFASFFMMFALPDFVPTIIGLPALSVM